MSYVVSLCREHSYPIISLTTLLQRKQMASAIQRKHLTYETQVRKTSRIPNLVISKIRGLHYHAPILNTSTAHQRVVDPRRNFELLCDWLKTGHVV